MARVSSVVQTGQPVRPLSEAVRKLALAGRSCAHCGSFEIRPSKTRNALDILLACVLLAPFRCRACRERFYRVRRPSLMRRTEPPAVAPLLVMPARSDALDITPLNTAPLNSDGTLPRLMEPEPFLPAREQPRLVPAARKTGAVKSAFIQRLEAGFRSPQLPGAQSGAVLILESDLSIRKLLRRLLDRRGYSTAEFARIGDLEAELNNRGAPLLVVDAAAEGIDAKVLEGLARAHPDLKILALSEEPLARTDQEIADRLLELAKPFSLDRFVECVDQLLGRPSKSQ